MNDYNNGILNMTWFGHSCFRIIIGDTVLFFDPVRKNSLLNTTFEPEKEKNPKAIFISHEHWDHCDPDTVLSLCSDSTKIYGPSSIENPLVHEMTFNMKDLEELKKASRNISIVKPNDLLDLIDIKIKCLAAQEGLSYLLLMGDKRILFMGDSPALPEK
jgi:L-ascorbate metabolism protein UlaG (beta-lactamase superfamily)